MALHGRGLRAEGRGRVGGRGQKGWRVEGRGQGGGGEGNRQMAGGEGRGPGAGGVEGRELPEVGRWPFCRYMVP